MLSVISSDACKSGLGDVELELMPRGLPLGSLAKYAPPSRSSCPILHQTSYCDGSNGREKLDGEPTALLVHRGDKDASELDDFMQTDGLIDRRVDEPCALYALAEDLKTIPSNSVEHLILRSIICLQLQWIHAPELEYHAVGMDVDNLIFGQLHAALKKYKLDSTRVLSILDSITPLTEIHAMVDVLVKLLRELFPFNILTALRHLATAMTATRAMDQKNVLLLIGNNCVDNARMIQFLSGRPASRTGVFDPVLIPAPDDEYQSIALCDPCLLDTACVEMNIVNGLGLSEAMKTCSSVKLVVLHNFNDHRSRCIENLINVLLDMITGISKWDRTRLRHVHYLYFGCPCAADAKNALVSLRKPTEALAANSATLWVLDDMIEKAETRISVVNPLVDDATLVVKQLLAFGDGLPADAVDLKCLMKCKALEKQATIELEQLQIALDVKELNVAGYHLSNLHKLKGFMPNGHAELLSVPRRIIDDTISKLSNVLKRKMVCLLTNCEPVCVSDKISLMEDVRFLTDLGPMLQTNVHCDALMSEELDKLVAFLSDLEVNDPRIHHYLRNCAALEADFNLLLHSRYAKDYQLLVSVGYAKLLERIQVSSVNIDCDDLACVTKIIFEAAELTPPDMTFRLRDPRIQCMQTIITGAEEYVRQVQAHRLFAFKIDGVDELQRALKRLRMLANHPIWVHCSAVCSDLLQGNEVDFDCHRPFESLVSALTWNLKKRLSFLISSLQHKLDGNVLEQYFIHMEMLEDLREVHKRVSLSLQCSIETIVYDQVMRLIRAVVTNPCNYVIAFRLTNAVTHVVSHRDKLNLRCNDIVQKIDVDVQSMIEQDIALCLRRATECGFDLAHPNEVHCIVAQLDAIEPWRTCVVDLVPSAVLWYEQAYSQLMQLLHRPLNAIAKSMGLDSYLQCPIQSAADAVAIQTDFINSIRKEDCAFDFAMDFAFWNTALNFLFSVADCGNSDWQGSCQALLVCLQASVAAFGELLEKDINFLWGFLLKYFPFDHGSACTMQHLETAINISNFPNNRCSPVNAMDATDQLEERLRLFQRTKDFPFIWNAINGTAKHHALSDLFSECNVHFKRIAQTALSEYDPALCKMFWLTFQRLQFADEMFFPINCGFGPDHKIEQHRAITSLIEIMRKQLFARTVEQLRCGIPLTLRSQIMLKEVWIEATWSLLRNIRQQVYINRPTRMLWSIQGYIRLKDQLREARSAVDPIFSDFITILSNEDMLPLCLELREIEEFIGSEVIDILQVAIERCINALEFVKAEEHWHSFSIMMETFPQCTTMPTSAVALLEEQLIATVVSLSQACVGCFEDLRQSMALMWVEKLEAAVQFGTHERCTVHYRTALNLLLNKIGQAVEQVISDLNGSITKENKGKHMGFSAISGQLAVLYWVINSSSELRRRYARQVDEVSFMCACG